ncbi:MAG: hypothetical protein QOJ45_2143 [Verrucomicrobiota bacterium]
MPLDLRPLTSDLRPPHCARLRQGRLIWFTFAVRRIVNFSLVYLAAYAVASYLDLQTTLLALQRPGTTEGNVYSTSGHDYVATKAWVITAAGALFIEAFLLFGALNAHRVSEHWLRHPIRSFAKFYVVFWSRRWMDRSPLHMLSFVIAFVPLRFLAAANNLMIYYYGTAPLGRLVGFVSRHTSPTAGFWLVMGTLFYLFAFACSPIAARLIVWLRSRDKSQRDL